MLYIKKQSTTHANYVADGFHKCRECSLVEAVLHNYPAVCQAKTIQTYSQHMLTTFALRDFQVKTTRKTWKYLVNVLKLDMFNICIYVKLYMIVKNILIAIPIIQAFNDLYFFFINLIYYLSFLYIFQLTTAIFVT